MNSIRDSGIDDIGAVSWGTHIGHLYSSTDDFKMILAPYINAGLKNNELCIWVYSQNVEYCEAKAILKTAVDDIDSYLEKKQLIIIPHTEWYILDNSFNELRVNSQWLDLIQCAEDNGYDGLRAVGDTAWLEHCYQRDFYIYEQNISGIISNLNFIVICLYDMRKVSVTEIAEIIQNHNFTFVSDKSGINVIKNIELYVKERELEESKKNLDKMQAFDKLKTEFISNISHELRTPLTVILSTVQLMQYINAQPLSNNIKDQAVKSDKYLKIIQQNCYRQLRLINNLIDISKIDSDYYELHLQNCNIVRLVEEITLSVSEYVENKGIALVFDTDAEEFNIACDPDQMERILLNLLSNATKFTGLGGSIWVNIRSSADKVAVIVKDTGKGISHEKLGLIFKRFHQADSSLSRMHEGSGIGLSLVKSLVEKHNGNIYVRSELGKGTEFTIELPLVTLPEAETEAFPQKSIYMQNHVEKINIEFSDIYS